MNNSTTQTIPNEYKLTEVGVIPIDWNVEELRNIVDFKNGKAHENFIVENGKYIVVNSKFISTEGEVVKYSNEYYCPTEKDSILMVMSDVPNGRAIAKCFLVAENNKYSVNQRICSLKPKIDPKFLFYKLDRNPYFLSFDDGVKQTNLRKDDILICKVGIPTNPLEQSSIGNVLFNINVLIQKTEKLIAKKRAIKQGVMQELLSGKRRLPRYKGEWKIKTIENLCRTFTKQTGFDYSATIKPKLINVQKEGFIPFIQNKDFEGKKINYKTDYFIPKEVAFGFPNILLNERCLLISISGSIGNVAVFSNENIAFVGGAVAVGKFYNTEILDWVMYYFQSYDGQNKLFGNVKAGSHHNLTLEDIRKIEIPIPPKEEQRSILDIVSTIDTELTRLETKLSKIQQAALKRSNIPENKRKPFYLYVDEFQNFATHSFTKMLSEGRKYKLRVTLAEQSTSQQDDKNIVNVILANVTTVVCFRTANYIDEELMLNQFAPYVNKGDISNLPKYNFYIKISALEPEEPFSGETIYIPLKKDNKKIEKLIETSRKNYAIVYKKPEVEKINGQIKNAEEKINEDVSESGVPNTPEFQEA